MMRPGALLIALGVGLSGCTELMILASALPKQSPSPSASTPVSTDSASLSPSIAPTLTPEPDSTPNVGQPTPAVDSTPRPTAVPNSTPSPARTAKPEPTDSPSDEPAGIVGYDAFPGEPYQFSGKGDKVINKFGLLPRMTTFKLKHSGSSNFAVWLLDSNGQKLDLVVNQIGAFNGTHGFGVENPGDYVLEVSADGDWSIDVQQPATKNPSSESSFSGTGEQVIGPVSLAIGLRKVSTTHAGSRNFSVWLHDESGKRKDLLANEIGAYEGEKTATVNAGAYFFSISADGDWTLQVQ